MIDGPNKVMMLTMNGFVINEISVFSRRKIHCHRKCMAGGRLRVTGRNMKRQVAQRTRLKILVHMQLTMDSC